MRRAVTPAIPPSMYRHFAIVTLALTTGLAMFAQGENREVQAARVVRPQPASSAAPPVLARATPSATSQQSPGAWGSDSEFDNSFGRPMENLIDGAGSLIPDLDAIAAPGYSPEYLASLSAEEREMLLQGLRDNGMLSPDIQEERAAALNAASRRRSGAASQEE
jgi:hypothetical protein